MRQSIASLIACTLLSSTVLVHAEDTPDRTTAGDAPAAVTETQRDGSVDLRGGSIAAGIGFSWATAR